jgi:hypothetical protein
VVKYIYTATNIEGQSQGRESVHAYDSVYTVMNEFTQVMAIYFIHGGDFEEMGRILAAVQWQYEIHGFDPIDLFYTDDPTHEYKMLIKAIPSLAKHDAIGPQTESSTFPLLPLPENHPMHAIDSYAMLSAFCNDLLAYIDNAQEEIVFLGLDIERDSLTRQDLTFKKPAMLQILDEAGNHMCIIKLQPTFGQIIESSLETTSSALKNVLQ